MQCDNCCVDGMRCMPEREICSMARMVRAFYMGDL